MNKKYIKFIAKGISEIANAPLVAIFVFTLINYVLLIDGQWVKYAAISSFFSGIMPIIISLIWIRNKKLETDIPFKEDRIYPLLLVIMSYVLGVAVLYWTGAPSLTTVLMICYLVNTAIVLLITLRWKISIHCMGVAGPATAMIYLLGYLGLIFSIIIPLVMWSRVYLKRHTPAQVVVGTLLGFALTTTQIYLLLGP